MMKRIGNVKYERRKFQKHVQEDYIRQRLRRDAEKEGERKD